MWSKVVSKLRNKYANIRTYKLYHSLVETWQDNTFIKPQLSMAKELNAIWEPRIMPSLCLIAIRKML